MSRLQVAKNILRGYTRYSAYNVPTCSEVKIRKGKQLVKKLNIMNEIVIANSMGFCNMRKHIKHDPGEKKVEMYISISYYLNRRGLSTFIDDNEFLNIEWNRNVDDESKEVLEYKMYGENCEKIKNLF